MSQLPVIDGDPDGSATRFWLERRHEVRRLVARYDPSRFLTWDAVVTGMTFGDLRCVRTELRALRCAQDWETRWRPALTEDLAGFPMPFPPYPTSSATLIHHAFHVLQFEQATGRRVTDFERCVEFGGGYGSLARLFGRLGFGRGYHLHDLPELSLLQQFFLASISDPQCAAAGYALSPSFSSRLADARSLIEGGSRPLFIATWSLSETPVQTRERWRPLLDRCSAFLLGYQDRFEGIDNTRWFTDYAATRPDIAWNHRPIGHRPANAYLIGASASS